MAKRGITGTRNYALLREYKSTRLTHADVVQLGAHAVGIGRKVVRGERTNTLALLFYVERKQARDKVLSELVPKAVPFVSRKDGRDVQLPTDVIETPRTVPLQDPESRLRPVPGGASFGIATAGGTLGGWLWDRTDDTLVGLSNNHVLGDTVNADVQQPSPGDGGSLPADKIGDVKRSIPRISPGTNFVDAAITDVDDPNNVDARVIDIGPAVYAADVVELDMLVEKFGQTTDHTYGEVTDIDYSPSSSDGFDFEDQFRIEPVAPTTTFADSGDSGSLVFSQTATTGDIKPVVGLLWGGGGGGGAASKIQRVFDALDLTTICAGLFAAFLDALFETDELGEVDTHTERELRDLASAAQFARRRPIAPIPLTRKEKELVAVRRFHTGISRDVQGRLETSKRGRIVTGLVDAHRGEIADMLIRDGDARRAAVTSLRPIVAGATTSTEVLERALTAEDIDRLTTLGKEVARRGSGDFAKRLKPALALLRGAEGKSAADILGIRL